MHPGSIFSFLGMANHFLGCLEGVRANTEPFVKIVNSVENGYNLKTDRDNYIGTVTCNILDL